jgi:hypothetical protein
MANIIPDGFKSELLKGSHNFKASGGNEFYIALYDTTLGPPYTTSSTIYSSDNECSSAGGSNYPAGGQALGNAGVTVPSANTAVVDFDPEVFSSVTISSVGAAIYNYTSSTNLLVLVLDFGGTKTATSGDFTIQFPSPTAADGILRVA